MNRHIRKYFLPLVLTLVTVSACDKDFDEINANPNVPATVTPNLLLPNIIRSSVNQITNEAWSIGNIVAQHTAKIQFVNEDRYLWGERNGIWNTYYTTLRDVENMISISSLANPAQNNYQGIALVMKAWMYSVITDAYGDIPYSNAIRGKQGQNFPAYDRQEAIYAGILADLQRANELLGSSAEAVTGDILYGGNITRWKKLANSLRLRYLMRISNRRDVAADLQAIVGNPGANPIFESNEDNGALRYLPTVPNQFPLYTSRVGSFDEYRLSKNLGDRLLALNDPRIGVFARPTVASVAAGTPEFVGVPNGLDDVAALTYNGGVQNVSRIGTPFYIDGFGTPTELDLRIARGVIMNYAELQFVLAEAAQKGWIAGNAQTFYEAGIRGSFDYYELELPEGYLTQAGVAFNAADALQLIGTQKWISLFFQGMEAWFDWRRTGIPTILPGPANLNEDRVPVRFLYPGSEFTLNRPSVEAAVSAQGPNDINTRVWWDVQ
jgi:hypothetical protein